MILMLLYEILRVQFSEYFKNIDKYYIHPVLCSWNCRVLTIVSFDFQNKIFIFRLLIRSTLI